MGTESGVSGRLMDSAGAATATEDIDWPTLREYSEFEFAVAAIGSAAGPGVRL